MRVSRRASDIRFRQIGFRQFSKPPRQIQIERKALTQGKSKFQSESYLSTSDEGEDDVQIEQIPRNSNTYSAIQDTRVSKFTHHKILIVQKNVLVLSLLVFFFGLVKLEVDGEYPQAHADHQIMTIMSSITAALVLLVVIRRVLKLQLEIDQRKIYIRADNRQKCKSSILLLLSYKRQVIMLLTEILVIIPHPNSLFKGVTYESYSQNYQANLTYSINDLLSVLMLAKIYLVFRSIISLTIYSSPRVVRLCRNGNFQYSLFFSVKCIQYQHPIISFFFAFFIILLLFAFGFRATQGTIHNLNQSIPVNGYQSFFNCLWFTFITMTSLGYGDYTPRTVIARFLAALLTIFGLTLNSFLVVAFSSYLTMKSEEIRSHTTLNRLQDSSQFKKKSAQTLTDILKLTQHMSKTNLDPLLTRKLKPTFDKLKKAIDARKSQARSIKATLPEENLTQIMIQEFQMLKDSFKQLYCKQQQIRLKIYSTQQDIFTRERARTRFLTEVQSVLNKYK